MKPEKLRATLILLFLLSLLFVTLQTSTQKINETTPETAEATTTYTWSPPYGTKPDGARSFNFSKVDSRTVEDRFEGFSIRYNGNDIWFFKDNTKYRIVNATPLNYVRYYETGGSGKLICQQLLPAAWGYTILFRHNGTYSALSVSHAWGENILITQLNGTVEVPKGFLSSPYTYETNGTDQATKVILSPGQYMLIYNAKSGYYKGTVEGIAFSNIPPFGHLNGLSYKVIYPNEVGKNFTVGSWIGENRTIYFVAKKMTLSYISQYVSLFPEEEGSEKATPWIGAVPVVLTSLFSERSDGVYGFSRFIPPQIGQVAGGSLTYADDPYASQGTFKQDANMLNLTLYYNSTLESWMISGYFVMHSTITDGSGPNTRAYGWFFYEFTVNDTIHQVNRTVGIVIKPTGNLRNYQQDGNTYGFCVWFQPRVAYRYTIENQKIYNGAWTSVTPPASGYDYYNGYWSIYATCTNWTTSHVQAWLEKVFLGDKTSLTPQSVLYQSYTIAVEIDEFDGTLTDGVEYGWIGKIVLSDNNITHGVPSPANATGQENLVKDKLALGDPPPSLSSVATSSIPGTLTVGYSPPEVLAVNLYNTSWTEVSSIDPYVEYWLNVTIRHNNTLYSLENITFYFYASGSNWNSADDPNTHATFVWDNSTKQYSLVGPTGTTWAVDTADCRVPDQSQNTGTFTLAFNASKVALMGTWYINVTAWGAQDLSDSLTISITVNFYAEIILADTSFQFSLSVGAANGSLTVPSDGDIDFSIICNAQYNVSFYTDGNWTSDSSEIDITNTNYFIGDDDSDPEEATETGIAPFAIHPTPDKATPYANQAVTQDDINGDAFAIYLFQTVPTGTSTGTYTLTLYIEVVTA